ncbi:MAG: universal stress protein [Armatimonadota bacterium]|nr:universal stress protein [Armatimonadota bacterium]MDR7404628.1 universal stress protein [Armatimonadota bacterium]
MRQRILVPVDLSAMSDAVVEAAADLARPLGAELRILHVFTPDDVADAQRERGDTPQRFVERLEESLRDLVRRRGVQADVEVCQGWSVPEQILETSRRWGATFIVMGTHGRRGWRRVLLGSVAEEVLRHASCPVLVIPAGARRDSRPAAVAG